MHCGYNDIAGARTWEDIEDDLDTIRGIIGSERIVYINQVIPKNNASAAWIALAESLNNNYAEYADNYGWRLVRCHNGMGVTSPHTGGPDTLNPTYSNGDAVHLSLAGVDALAELMRPYID